MSSICNMINAHVGLLLLFVFFQVTLRKVSLFAIYSLCHNDHYMVRIVESDVVKTSFERVYN